MEQNNRKDVKDQVEESSAPNDEDPLSVGHLETGEKVPSGVIALRKGLIRRDEAIANRKNAFFSELFSDSPSFVEVGHAAVHAAMEMSLGPVTHAVLPIFSATAAGYMLWALNDEQKKDKQDLSELLDIWKRYKKAKTHDDRMTILSEAGLSLEALPADSDGLKDFDYERFSLLARANETSKDLTKRTPGERIRLGAESVKKFTGAVTGTVWNVLRAVPGNVLGIGKIAVDTGKAMHTFYKLNRDFNKAAKARKKIIKSYFNDETTVKRIENAATGELDLSKLTVDKVEVLGQQHDIAPETIAQIKKIQQELNEEIKSVYKNGTCLFAQSFFIMFNIAQAALVNGPAGSPMIIANIAGASMALEPLKEFAHSLEEANKKINSKLADEAAHLAKLAMIGDDTEKNDAEDDSDDDVEIHVEGADSSQSRKSSAASDASGTKPRAPSP